MFTRLVESERRRNRSLPQLGVSFVFHLAVAVAAVTATRGSVSANADRPRVDARPFVVPATPRPEPARTAPSSQAVPDGPPLPADVISVPVPTGLETTIPPIESGPAIDPRRFLVGSAPPGCFTCAAGEHAVDAVLEEAAVDQPVVATRQPPPVYPPVLKAAGISGRATLEFVVDTTGRVESGSIRVLNATHESFGASAAAALERSLFRPAVARGRVVRQLVRQAISFRIE